MAGVEPASVGAFAYKASINPLRYSGTFIVIPASRRSRKNGTSALGLFIYLCIHLHAEFKASAWL